MDKLSPIVSEFDGEEDAASYKAWLADKVARSLAGTAPLVPHDDVMRGATAIIDAVRNHAAASVA